jgi:hypothetical protein
LTRRLGTDPSLYDQRAHNPPRHSSEDCSVKPGIIFGVVLVIIIGAIIYSHQMTQSGNKHFDKAGENWKQN